MLRPVQPELPATDKADRIGGDVMLKSWKPLA